MAQQNKDDRLQLRMHPRLKRWFKQDAEDEGGMSRVVHQHVEERFAQKTGTTWSPDDGPPPAKETGAAVGAPRDPA